MTLYILHHTFVLTRRFFINWLRARLGWAGLGWAGPFRAIILCVLDCRSVLFIFDLGLSWGGKDDDPEDNRC